MPSSRPARTLQRLSIYPHLVLMYVRAQMEYRGAFWIDRVAMAITYFTSFAVIWLIVARFEQLAGWYWADLALLFAFHMLSYATGAALSFTQMRRLEEHVRLGTLDPLLVKPINTWAYLVFSGFNIGYVSHLSLGLGLLIWALFSVDIQWSLGSVAYFVASLVSSALVTGALMTMIGATALIWVRSNHLYSLYFGFWELSRYPLNVFPVAIQGVMLTIVPLGFMAAVPVAVLLGKPVPLLGDWAAPAALLAGPVLTALAVLHWRYALTRYQGAGG